MTRAPERQPVDSLNDLIAMLEYRRPAGSKSERKFINRFIRTLGAKPDSYGNWHISVGNNPTVLWSAHTDSVHRTPGRQKLIIDAHSDKPSISVAHGECLGADNGAGCWVLREMILAGIPGHYVFHREEESGGNGSRWIAKHLDKLVGSFKAAIAFDRRATTSIITHQWGGRCCSDTFAKSLGEAMGLPMVLDDGGSFTDTASYTDLIGECTNVSVGYFREHSSDETLDLLYLFDLRDAMVAFDASKLVFERKPGEKDPDLWAGWGGYYGCNYGGPGSRSWRYGSSSPQPDVPHTWRHECGGYLPARTHTADTTSANDDDLSDLYEAAQHYETAKYEAAPTLAKMCRDFPLEVADYLEQFGIDPEELWDHVLQIGHGTMRRK